MSRLHLAESTGKTQPAHRNQLLELRISAGLSVAGIFLRDFLKARPDASLADCLKAARIIATYTVAEVPGHVATEDVVEILDVLREKGGRR
jgi:hypothetical protein